jgi:uncharacterized protein YfcZ (UPF0381/DUF406 family)
MAKKLPEVTNAGYVISGGAWYVRDIMNGSPRLSSLGLATVYSTEQEASDALSEIKSLEAAAKANSIKRTYKVVSLNEFGSR